MAIDKNQIPAELKRAAKCEEIGMGAMIQNRYQVIAYLGRGGMSTVYKAVDMTSGQVVALKVLHSELLSDSSRVQRFLQEAKTYKNLRHEHIVKTFDFFTDEFDRYIMVMEYMEGRNLSEELSEKGRLTIRRAIKIFSEICDALDHAHSQGIVHRDLKPSNISLIDTDKDIDFVKVLDFGIAKLMPTDSETQLGLTQTGEIVGSPLYMSPEQCMAKAIDHRSDIYSLGCLMYECITGEPPLMGGNVYETFHMQTHERPKPLGDVRPEFKSGTKFEFIILKCMAKNPRHRYQTMSELKEALQQVGSSSLSGGQIGKLINAWQERKIKERAAQGRSLPPALVAAVTAVVIIACGFLFQERIRQFIEPADSRYNKAIAQYRQALDGNKYDAAEQAAKSALKIAEEERKQWLVPALQNLMDLYRVEGRTQEAQAVNVRLQKIAEEGAKATDKAQRKLLSKLKAAISAQQVEPEVVEDICFQLIDLSNTYVDTQQFEQARTVLNKTLDIVGNTLGDKSLIRANLEDNLALLSLKDNLKEDYQDIDKQLSQAIANREKIGGSESTGLIRTLEALSEVQKRLGELPEARDNAAKALSIARNAFRSTSYQAAVSKCQVAEIDLAMKKPSSAISGVTTALAAIERSKESDQLIQAHAHIILGEAKAADDQYGEAIKDFEQSEDMLKEATDTQALLLARALTGLGDIYSTRAKHDYARAAGYYRRAMALMFRSRAREEVRVLHVVNKLTEIYNREGTAEEALQLYKILADLDRDTGKTKGLIEDLKLIGSYCRENLKLKEAARRYEEALTQSQTFYGSSSPTTCELSALLADTYLNAKNKDKAQPLILDAIKTLELPDVNKDMSRESKLKVLSIYARYLESTGDREKLQEVKEKINSV